MVDLLIKELINNNISYVLITNENYVEIHFLDNIYRLYCFENIIFENIDPFSELFKKLSCNNTNKRFTDSVKIPIERPGFKRYTKKEVRKDNKNNIANIVTKRRY